jgi:hypothetical protein
METLTEQKTWKDYIPEYVSLYYVDYRNDLSKHADLLSECIRKNSLYPLSETVYDWWDSPESQYMSEVESAMEADGLADEYAENEDEIRDAIYAKDDSNPVDDLLGNTGNIGCFYTLGVGYCESCFASEGEIAENAVDICNILDAHSDKQIKLIHSLVENATYGGNLRIYFSAPLKDMLTNEGYDEERNEFKSIHFKGTFVVALHDGINGAAEFEEIYLDVVLPFKRQNLFHYEDDRYDVEKIFGMGHSYWNNLETPKFLMVDAAEGKTIPTSTHAETVAKEAEYQKTYEKGGCTFEDSKLSRHRTEYVNCYPCGWHCKDCGRFWID